jgi:hypothetical protein
MATITLAPALARWRSASPMAGSESVTLQTNATTLRGALEDLFREYPQIRGYVVDERGVIRHHVVVFVDNVAATDKVQQTEPLTPSSEVYVFQALSGG